jgi:large subunit ribosomal protein L17
VRHARTGKKLGRDSAHRRALYANLAGALIEHGRIRTTVTKAKAVRPFAEQMITLGRRGDLHARRQATAFLRSRDVVHKLFAEVAPLFKDRPGGYTRIVKIGPRPGDAAEMAYLELVEEAYVARERAARATAPVPAEDVETPEPEEHPQAETAAETEGAEAEAEAPEPADAAAEEADAVAEADGTDAADTASDGDAEASPPTA